VNKSRFNFTKLSFELSYRYPNSCYEKYFRVVRCAFSGGVFFGFVFYISAQFSGHDPSCFVLGFLGLIACNPAAIWLSDYPTVVTALDAVLLPLFLHFFRYACFEKVRSGKPSLWLQTYFMLFCALEIWFKYNTNFMVTSSDSTPVFVHNLCLASYAVLVLCESVYASFCRSQVSGKATWIVGFIVIQCVALIAAVVHDVGSGKYAILALSAAPELFLLAAHFTGTTLFLLWSPECRKERSKFELL
jgi:hypothetical protein